MTLIGNHATPEQCDEAEARIKAALRDAIRAHQTVLADHYRGELAELDVIRDSLQIPEPRKP